MREIPCLFITQQYHSHLAEKVKSITIWFVASFMDDTKRCTKPFSD